MPNFDVSVVSGVTPTRWEDARAPHRGANVHIYRRVVLPTAPGLASVILYCTIGGLVPADFALGGNLFIPSRVGWSGSFPFSITQPTPSLSALIVLSFAANMAGHQELAIRRGGGGAIVLSFEVE